MITSASPSVLPVPLHSGVVSPAFKDWAVIVEALGRGRQALILRKGGIAEGRSGFTVAHRRFWLFPTLYHQQLARTRPEAADLIGQLPEKSPDYAVPIRWVADVSAADIWFLEDWAKVKALAPYHIWNEDVIEERFCYGGEDGIHAIICRVHALPQPRVLAWSSAFEGCKSWIDVNLPLTEDALGESLTPVLADAEFDALRAGIRSACG
ncbi:hypothetical protein DB346_24710 [Verrucomicrobia bacterium LW23]|nr:hypothetical protein DB346_24710 [Verrucomicrobia bacterium LW23]